MAFVIPNTTPSKKLGALASTKLYKACEQLIHSIVDRQRLRAGMGRLSARELRDIGLTENDVAQAQTVSLIADASDMLQRERHKRSGNW